jgi:restriction system protein
MSSQRFWFVRAGEGAAYLEEFLSQGLVAIGWKNIGPLDPAMTNAELDKRFQAAYPEEREGSRKVWAAQVKRFTREIKVGDSVATYGPEQRTYYLGTIESEAAWRDGDMPRFRKVKWSQRAYRDQLSIQTRNTLGAIATLFLVSDDASRELRDRAVPIASTEPPPPPKPATPADVSSEMAVRSEIEKKAEQFVEDSIVGLDWSQLQQLVAGILRAMGYKTRVSDQGPDRGMDIFASPDGLGLQEPRIFVEVKHRLGTPVGSQDLRAFLGGRKAGDKCLYVSTGGFSKDAKYEANRASVPLELVTLPDLRNLLIEHYENLDSETRSLVPLRRIYWPGR